LRSTGKTISAARPWGAFRSSVAALGGLAAAYRSIRALGGLAAPPPSIPALGALAVTYPPPLKPGPRRRLRNRVLMTTYVTAVEIGGLYAWLRLTRSGRGALGAACLVVKETFESGILLLIFIRGPQQRYDPADPAVAAHLRRAQLESATAFDSEILIWLLSYTLSEEAGLPLAGAFLLVSMHLKHQLEAAIMYDEPYWSQVLKPVVVVGSLTESLGGIASLWLTRVNRRLHSAAALLAGIGIEHVLFINAVQKEMEWRDICLPRPPRRAADA
jgi:hypothetical protein